MMICRQHIKCPVELAHETSSATYTTPANCKAIRLKMVGGGGAAATNGGSAGGDTIFNSIHAKDGSGGSKGGTSQGGAGGSGGTGTANLRITGQDGMNGYNPQNGTNTATYGDLEEPLRSVVRLARQTP
jgi:hypothetical protein